MGPAGARERRGQEWRKLRRVFGKNRRKMHITARKGKGVKTGDLPRDGLALGRRWHVRGCCLRARSSGQAGRAGVSSSNRPACGVLTFDTFQQRAEGEAERLKAGGPYREAEIGRAAACFFVPDWSCELRYRLLPSDKTVAARKKVLLICSHLQQFSRIISPPNHLIPLTR